MSTGIYIALGVVAVIVIIIIICVFSSKPVSTAITTTSNNATTTASNNGTGSSPTSGTQKATSIKPTQMTKQSVVTSTPALSSVGTKNYPSTIAATDDNYLYWATGIAAYMSKYANNPQLTSQFNGQLSAAVNNFLGLQTSYGLRYTTDTNTVGNYNSNYPNLNTYPTLISAISGNGGIGLLSSNGVPLTMVTTLTPQVVFHNMVNVMATMAKNNVQANTQGQAIGTYQGKINAATMQMNEVEDTEESIPSQAQECVLNYTYSLAPNDWPAGVQSGSNINQIVGGVVAAVGIVLVATGVGTAIGVAVVSVGAGIAKIPN